MKHLHFTGTRQLHIGTTTNSELIGITHLTAPKHINNTILIAVYGVKFREVITTMLSIETVYKTHTIESHTALHNTMLNIIRQLGN